MAASTETRGRLSYGWSLGESNWKAGMDANLLKISRLAIGGLYVEDRNLTAPPGSPTNGAAYIVAATATGAWVGKENQIAIWDGAAWVFYPASIGWQCYIKDEEKLTVFKAAGWSAGIAI